MHERERERVRERQMERAGERDLATKSKEYVAMQRESKTKKERDGDKERERERERETERERERVLAYLSGQATHHVPGSVLALGLAVEPHGVCEGRCLHLALFRQACTHTHAQTFDDMEKKVLSLIRSNCLFLLLFLLTWETY